MRRPQIVFAIHGISLFPKFEVEYLELELANSELEPGGAIERGPNARGEDLAFHSPYIVDVSDSA
jgi:hypothetical protein